jgi:hypothetical protein
MTACVRDLALTYPGVYDINVWTSCPSLWKENPHIKEVWNKPKPGIPRYDLTYGHHINQANQLPLHFLTAFHRNLNEQLKLEVPVLYPKGDLHLSEWHKQNRPIAERYWYWLAGGKNDFTTKIWSSTRHQQAINLLRQFGLRIVQGGANHQGHWHPTMDGVLNMVNKTNLRDMMWLIYHSEGVVCTITAAMHMAAAFDRPCVVIAGGREHWWWEAYVNVNMENFGPQASGKVVVPHRYLHTQGLLDCCRDRGCWRNKVVATQQDSNKSYCKYPEGDGYGQTIPKCLKMITVNHVMEAVMWYYTAGILPDPQRPYTATDHYARLSTEAMFQVPSKFTD